MEETIQIITNRVNSLKLELETPYMGEPFYEDIKSRIDELESLLIELKAHSVVTDEIFKIWQKSR